MAAHGTIRLEPAERILGRLSVPGDKSISHRALLFAAVAGGRSRIRGLSPGADVASTRRAVARLGIAVREEGGDVLVEGSGWRGLDRDPGLPALELDCGNSGTTARLLLGLLAGRRGRFRLHGDASLSRRPMDRVLRPLARFGLDPPSATTLPVEIVGTRLRGARVDAEVPSAQVKGALLLAALQAEGESEIRVPGRSRDHTERMLAALGAPVRTAGDGRIFRVAGGGADLEPFDLAVPGDPSSAAFFVALACARPGSELVVEGVSLNPTRLGFVRLLRRMGASIEQIPGPERAIEPAGTLVARGGRLHGIAIDAGDVADAIDEIPLLAVVAAAADGETVIRGAAELRLKESDRIRATAALLRAAGARAEEFEDGLAVRGGSLRGGGEVDAAGDHRIAMSAAVAAALAERPLSLRGAEWVSISYPSFFEDLARLTR
ncbi:MAG: 3-phosphoshikimate 1-carboxyvinyltransferase [Acidobacteria bacterium]|nr:MAG: 3-phosphoshikimate 1-carboxyvinyltransferase [Acidobacteriota bacterium]